MPTGALLGARLVAIGHARPALQWRLLDRLPTDARQRMIDDDRARFAIGDMAKIAALMIAAREGLVAHL